MPNLTTFLEPAKAEIWFRLAGDSQYRAIERLNRHCAYATPSRGKAPSSQASTSALAVPRDQDDCEILSI